MRASSRPHKGLSTRVVSVESKPVAHSLGFAGIGEVIVETRQVTHIRPGIVSQGLATPNARHIAEDVRPVSRPTLGRVVAADVPLQHDEHAGTDVTRVHTPPTVAFVIPEPGLALAAREHLLGSRRPRGSPPSTGPAGVHRGRRRAEDSRPTSHAGTRVDVGIRVSAAHEGADVREATVNVWLVKQKAVCTERTRERAPPSAATPRALPSRPACPARAIASENAFSCECGANSYRRGFAHARRRRSDGAVYSDSCVPFSVGRLPKPSAGVLIESPFRFRRPKRWTTEGHGASSDQRRCADMSMPASITCVLTQDRGQDTLLQLAGLSIGVEVQESLFMSAAVLTPKS